MRLVIWEEDNDALETVPETAADLAVGGRRTGLG